MRKKIILLFLLIFLIFVKLMSKPIIINPVEIDLSINPNKPYYNKGEIVEINYDIYLNKRISTYKSEKEYLIQTDYSEENLKPLDYDVKNTLFQINDNNYKLNGIFRFETLKSTGEIKMRMKTFRLCDPDKTTSKVNKIIWNSHVSYYSKNKSSKKIKKSYYDLGWSPSKILNNTKGKFGLSVKDINGNLLKDVKVKIIGLDKEKFTNEKDLFLMFINIPKGRYDIQIEKEGYLKYYIRGVLIENKLTTLFNQYLPIYNSRLDSMCFIEYYQNPFRTIFSTNSTAKGVDLTGDLLIDFSKALQVLNLSEPFYFIIDELKIGVLSFNKPSKKISNLPCGIYTLKAIIDNYGEKAFNNIEIKNNSTTNISLDNFIVNDKKENQ